MLSVYKTSLKRIKNCSGWTWHPIGGADRCFVNAHHRSSLISAWISVHLMVPRCALTHGDSSLGRRRSLAGCQLPGPFCAGPKPLAVDGGVRLRGCGGGRAKPAPRGRGGGPLQRCRRVWGRGLVDGQASRPGRDLPVQLCDLSAAGIQNRRRSTGAAPDLL